MRFEINASDITNYEVVGSDAHVFVKLRFNDDYADGIFFAFSSMADVERLEQLAHAARNEMTRAVSEMVADALNVAAASIPVELRARWSDVILDVVESEVRDGNDIDSAIEKGVAAAWTREQATLKVVS